MLYGRMGIIKEERGQRMKEEFKMKTKEFLVYFFMSLLNAFGIGLLVGRFLI